MQLQIDIDIKYCFESFCSKFKAFTQYDNCYGKCYYCHCYHAVNSIYIFFKAIGIFFLLIVHIANCEFIQVG